MNTIHDLSMIEAHYESLEIKLGSTKTPLTLTEKILYAHLATVVPATGFRRAQDYVDFRPDRVAMQDATAQMALLQFMNAGRERVALPSSVHCDHLIKASTGAATDLSAARTTNGEVYRFLAEVSDRYGIGFWSAGAGIIHQVVLENYAFPGGMMIGTDSHTPNAGGLGMMAIGVGGADAADVMSGLDWELKMPRVIGVELTGSLSGWCSAKDVILKLAGLLTVKGGTNSVIEYFGTGAATISATGKATICNMGAEVGATCSIFPYDDKMKEYLVATNRQSVATLADRVKHHLVADTGAVYDQIIHIDLSEIEPYINGPFTPDAAWPISKFATHARAQGYPERLDVALIGSCTNSSYEDLARSAGIAADALNKGIEPRAEFIVTPGSTTVYDTAKRDGMIEVFERMGATIMANACGACIGQWARKGVSKEPNSIVTSFNRNFAARNDGNPLTHAFVVSPELATALWIAGSITFNPTTDTLAGKDGKPVRLAEPSGDELPTKGYASGDNGYIAPSFSARQINIEPTSDRLQILKPFERWATADCVELELLIKTVGKCTTDHISAAGPWLKYRGHLENISQNLLMAATNAFNGKADSVFNKITKEYDRVSASAALYRHQSMGTIVVAQENYGEGSSREHAAMEPRFMGVRVVVAQSFARIHETNLKKQGVLALTFNEKSDYDKISEHDSLVICGLDKFEPYLIARHENGTEDRIEVRHTYNAQQTEWFRAGSALNHLAKSKRQ